MRLLRTVGLVALSFLTLSSAQADELDGFRDELLDYCAKYESYAKADQQIESTRIAERILPGDSISSGKITNPQYRKYLKTLDDRRLYVRCPEAIDHVAMELVIRYEMTLGEERRELDGTLLGEVGLGQLPKEFGWSLVGLGTGSLIRHRLKPKKSFPVRTLPLTLMFLGIELYHVYEWREKQTDPFPHPLDFLTLGVGRPDRKIGFLTENIGINLAHTTAFFGAFELASIGIKKIPRTKPWVAALGAMALSSAAMAKPAGYVHDRRKLADQRKALEGSKARFDQALKAEEISERSLTLHFEEVVRDARTYHGTLAGPLNMRIANFEQKSLQLKLRILTDILHTEWALRGGNPERHPDVQSTLLYLSFGLEVGKMLLEKEGVDHLVPQGYAPPTVDLFDLKYDDWLFDCVHGVAKRMGSSPWECRSRIVRWDPNQLMRSVRPEDPKWRDQYVPAAFSACPPDDLEPQLFDRGIPEGSNNWTQTFVALERRNAKAVFNQLNGKKEASLKEESSKLIAKVSQYLTEELLYWANVSEKTNYSSFQRRLGTRIAELKTETFSLAIRFLLKQASENTPSAAVHAEN